MPKLKTSKGTAKRFRMNKKRRAKRGIAGRSHILTKKSRKRKRKKRKTGWLNATDNKRIRKLLPYG